MSDQSPQEFTLTAQEAAALRQGFTYCPKCRTEMVDREVYGRVRRICPNKACRFVQFIDPKVSAAVMALRDDKVLMVKRVMEPAQGSWCFPGGFMEMGETPQETAIRECKEESGFDVEITQLVDVFAYKDYRGTGVLIMYKGTVVGGQAQAGDDAQKVRFFGQDNLPENIQFDTNVETLDRWRRGEL